MAGIEGGREGGVRRERMMSEGQEENERKRESVVFLASLVVLKEELGQ